jgi:adenosylhomocysteinase
MENWRKTQPLKGLSILDATPIFRNTLIKYKALLLAGANLSVGVTEKLPADPTILNKLREWGIPLIHTDAAGCSFDFVLDCAASFANVKARIGYVELTRSGVETYVKKGCPVYVADSGRIKKIETCLGTGESYFRAMKQLGFNDWRDKNLVVFGCGKVGLGIVVHAHKLGAVVTVVTELSSVTPRISEYASEIIGLSEQSRIAGAIQKAYTVVTATGVAGAMEKICPPEIFINSPAILANMGVEDEYGALIPNKRILADKIAVNFTLEEPTLLRYIEATMALHNEGAVYLAHHPESKGEIIPPAETENQMLAILKQHGIFGEELFLIEDE